MNAWLVSTLEFAPMDATTARIAFAGATPEISTNTPKWEGLTLRNLP